MKRRAVLRLLAQALEAHDARHEPRPAPVMPSVWTAGILTGLPAGESPQVLAFPVLAPGVRGDRQPIDLRRMGWRLVKIDPHEGQMLDTSTTPHRWVDAPPPHRLFATSGAPLDCWPAGTAPSRPPLPPPIPPSTDKVPGVPARSAAAGPPRDFGEQPWDGGPVTVTNGLADLP